MHNLLRHVAAMSTTYAPITVFNAGIGTLITVGMFQKFSITSSIVSEMLVINYDVQQLTYGSWALSSTLAAVQSSSCCEGVKPVCSKQACIHCIVLLQACVKRDPKIIQASTEL
jgi:hypothetical protein